MYQMNLLVVEGSLSMTAIYKAYLSATDYQVRIVTDLASAQAELERQVPDILLIDVELPDGSSPDLIRQVKTDHPRTEVIAITAYGSSEMAVQAINDGALDFLTKPFDAARLKVTLDNARRHRELNIKVGALASFERTRYCGFLGGSLPMQAAYKTIDSLAASRATAFIRGESGTGKQLAAEAIHQQSDRAPKPFYAINCGAIPGELMESELFGHIKGAFTGAITDREGGASIASGGTLFLDEICELDLDLQKKLLRFLQTSSFSKLGSNKTNRVDIRFICATNRDPFEEVRAGRFREDLYHRLHVVPVYLPPLRERDGDVELLANAFLHQFSMEGNKRLSGFSMAAMHKLAQYHWPGNVRELQNVIRHIVALYDSELVEEYMLPELAASDSQATKPGALIYPSSGQNPASDVSAELQPSIEDSIIPLWRSEKREIERAVFLCKGNINRAAERLELAPSTLHRRIRLWKTKEPE